MQWAYEIAASESLVGSSCSAARFIADHVHEGVDQGISRVDGSEEGIHDLCRRDLSVPDHPGEVEPGYIVQLTH
jgi:hypothetical protein